MSEIRCLVKKIHYQKAVHHEQLPVDSKQVRLETYMCNFENFKRIISTKHRTMVIAKAEGRITGKSSKVDMIALVIHWFLNWIDVDYTSYTLHICFYTYQTLH